MAEANATQQENPLKGVHGWLKLFVVVNRFVQPILFVLQYIIAWIGFVELAKNYGGIIIVGLIETVVGGFLVWKWMCLAKDLQEIKAGIVKEVKKWMQITLAWTILSSPIAFLSGMDAEVLLPGIAKSIISGLISFGIWYTYFNVSKRVKATYTS